MGTLTITAANFAALPATAPSDWPANLTWPGGTTVNGSKAYTISDADWVKLMAWAANANNAQIVAALNPPAGTPPPYTVSGVQVLLSLVQNWIQGMIQAQQVHATIPAQQPPPVTIS
jgi:hypothetical protein